MDAEGAQGTRDAEQKHWTGPEVGITRWACC